MFLESAMERGQFVHVGEGEPAIVPLVRTDVKNLSGQTLNADGLLAAREYPGRWALVNRSDHRSVRCLEWVPLSELNKEVDYNTAVQGPRRCSSDAR